MDEIRMSRPYLILMITSIKSLVFVVLFTMQKNTKYNYYFNSALYTDE